jgi:hypothetical protein
VVLVRGLLGAGEGRTIQSGERGDDLGVHLLGAVGAIQEQELLLVAIIVEQLNGLAEEDIQPVRDLLWGVVGALVELAAIVVADARLGGRASLGVPDMPLCAAEVAMGEAVEQHLARNIQVDDAINPLAQRAEPEIQLARLRDVARETIQDDDRVVAQRVQTREDHANDNIIRHQVAAVIVRLRVAAQRSTPRDLLAQQIPAGAGLEAQLLGEHLRLRTFAAALCADQDQIHAPVPPRVS